MHLQLALAARCTHAEPSVSQHLFRYPTGRDLVAVPPRSHEPGWTCSARQLLMRLACQLVHASLL
jgi:hypothetical protein